jgi:hypothetical protein
VWLHNEQRVICDSSADTGVSNASYVRGNKRTTAPQRGRFEYNAEHHIFKQHTHTHTHTPPLELRQVQNTAPPNSRYPTSIQSPASVHAEDNHIDPHMPPTSSSDARQPKTAASGHIDRTAAALTTLQRLLEQHLKFENVVSRVSPFALLMVLGVYDDVKYATHADSLANAIRITETNRLRGVKRRGRACVLL